MLNFLVRLVVSFYLRSALLIGCHRHVYRLTSKWGGSSGQMPVRYRVAANMQPLLCALGYHRCPSCGWATEKPSEHIEVERSWCWEVWEEEQRREDELQEELREMERAAAWELWEQTLPKCSCCGLPERDCQMESEADEADIDTYAEEQRREDELQEDQEELREMQRVAARWAFEDEQIRQQEADEEALGM